MIERRCERWAHLGGELGDRCSARIRDGHGPWRECGSRVVAYNANTGLPKAPNLPGKPQVTRTKKRRTVRRPVVKTGVGRLSRRELGEADRRAALAERRRAQDRTRKRSTSEVGR